MMDFRLYDTRWSTIAEVDVWKHSNGEVILDVYLSIEHYSNLLLQQSDTAPVITDFTEIEQLEGWNNDVEDRNLPQEAAYEYVTNHVRTLFTGIAKKHGLKYKEKKRFEKP